MWTSISSWQHFDQRDDQHAEAEKPCRRIGIADRKVFARRSKNLPQKALDCLKGFWVSGKLLRNRKVLALSGKFSTGWKVLLQFLELCLVFCSIVAKNNYTVCPESFCALTYAHWKVLTFWASGLMLAVCPTRWQGGRRKRRPAHKRPRVGEL